MLVSLNVENLTTSSRAPIDLVCVIDRSGSMRGQKIELVKNTFKYLLEYLGDSDRLSIVIFDTNASRLIPLTRTTEANKQIILSKIQTINAQGGTNINLGMAHAFSILGQRRQSNSVTSIFLLSDGLDGGAQTRVKASLSQFKVEENVTINTFGFGSDHDPQLMTDIASLRDGSFYFIKEFDKIDEAFVDCLGGLLTSVAQNAIIKITPQQSSALQGVEITKAYGDESMWNSDNQTYITKLSNVISGRQKDFILELKIPVNKNELQDHEKDICVATAEAVITGLDNNQVIKKSELRITLLNEVEEVKDEEEDDREVMKNFFRVKGASLMDEARKLADQNKNEDAKKILTSFKEELENSFLKEEEFIKNLVKDILKAIDGVQPEFYQQMGRHEMLENARAQMYQKSNMVSANAYRNEGQERMHSQLKSMKKF